MTTPPRSLSPHVQLSLPESRSTHQGQLIFKLEKGVLTKYILLTIKLLHRDIKSVLYSEINTLMYYYGVELSFLYRGVLYSEGAFSKVSMLPCRLRQRSVRLDWLQRSIFRNHVRTVSASLARECSATDGPPRAALNIA